MRVILIAALFGFVALNVSAQDEPKIKYGGMQQLGIAVEANAVNAMPNLINGVRYKDWFFGLGVAYEIKSNGWWSQGVNTMPVYLDARHYFFKRKWVFALADVGTNVVLGNEWMRTGNNDRYVTHLGYYANLGCGVRARLGKATYYSFDVSYNFKQTRYDRYYTDWQDRPLDEFNNFKQRRILIRMGMEI